MLSWGLKILFLEIKEAQAWSFSTSTLHSLLSLILKPFKQHQTSQTVDKSWMRSREKSGWDANKQTNKHKKLSSSCMIKQIKTIKLTMLNRHEKIFFNIKAKNEATSWITIRDEDENLFPWLWTFIVIYIEDNPPITSTH
jgi:hypothetical protein